MGEFLRPFRGALVSRTANLVAADLRAITAIGWDTETYDHMNFHDNVTNNSRFTIPAGVNFVRVSGSVQFAGTLLSGDFATLHLMKNAGFNAVGLGGQTYDGSNTSPRLHVSSGIMPVVATDYFELGIVVETDPSSDLDFNRCWFQLEMMG